MHSYRSAHCSSQGEVAELSLPRYGTVSGLGFATGKAGSPMHLAESSSTLLSLWTGLSLPVALHPASHDAVTFSYGQASVPVRKGLSPFCWCVLSGAPFPGTSCQATIGVVPTGCASRHFATASISASSVFERR